MTGTPGDGRRATSHHRYRAMRDFVQSLDDTVPGRFEITKKGIVHDITAGVGRHELTAACSPDNDWVGKVRDYPLIGIPVYAIFDPRTGTGAVLTDIHPTPEGPRYATRKDFVYGEDVTIADWTISTDGLPRYTADEGRRG
ncbi:hypothetical protein [Streptomyces sp. NPDC005374]|uniref:hypothetical protein n=1 Tax=Streptomyces sp. NPDC005374 TaxID=3364713 RepID=UPI0036965E27